MIWSVAFWKGAGERAIKTFVQTFFSVLLVSGIAATTTREQFLAMPWETSLISAALATFASLGMAVGNARFTAGEPDTGTD